MIAINWLYDEEFKQVFINIGKDLWEDLRQEIALIILEYDINKIEDLTIKGKQVFKFWVVRICCNQVASKTGKMWRMYNTIIPVEDINLFLKDEGEVEYNTDDIVKQIRGKIEKLHWYDKAILELYIEYKSYRKVSEVTQIPHTSIFITLKNVRKCLITSISF